VNIRPLILTLTLVPACVSDTPADDCYTCETRAVKDYCGYSETTVITDTLCDVTEDDVRRFEEKNTFVMDEKCFYLVQTCKCERNGR